MTERECIQRLLPLAEGFVKSMLSDPSRYPAGSVSLAVDYLREARRLLGWPVPAAEPAQLPLEVP